MNIPISYCVALFLFTILFSCDKKYKKAPELLTLENSFKVVENEYSGLCRMMEKQVALGGYLSADSAMLAKANRMIKRRKQINTSDSLFNSYIDLVYDEYYKENRRINPDLSQINRIRTYWKKFKTEHDSIYYYYAMLEIVQIEENFVVTLLSDLMSDHRFSENICKSQDTVKLGNEFSVVLILRNNWIGFKNKLEQKDIHVWCDGIKQRDSFYYEKLGDAYIIKLRPSKAGTYTIDLPIFTFGSGYGNIPHKTTIKTRFYSIN